MRKDRTKERKENSVINHVQTKQRKIFRKKIDAEKEKRLDLTKKKKKGKRNKKKNGKAAGLGYLKTVSLVGIDN